jgi:hypothetical protein
MNVAELRDISITLIAATLTSVLLFRLIRRFPDITLASVYIKLHIGLFFLLLGTVPAVAIHAETPQLRIILLYFLAGSVVGIALMLFSMDIELTIVLYAGVGLVFALLVTIAFQTGTISREMLYHGIGALSSELLIFGLLYNGVVIFHKRSAEYVIPFILLMIVFVSVIEGLRLELPESGS